MSARSPRFGPAGVGIGRIDGAGNLGGTVGPISSACSKALPAASRWR